MPRPVLTRMEPRQAISSRDLNEVFDIAEKFAGTAHPDFVQTTDHFAYSGPDVELIAAKITGNDSGTPRSYSWLEAYVDTNGQFADLDGGRQSTTTDWPARERVDSASAIPNGTYVWLRRTAFNYLLVEQAGSSGGGGTTPTFKDDKAHSVTSNTHKIINSTVVLSGGEAVTTIDDAAFGIPGIVNANTITTQEMGSGDKGFQRKVYFGVTPTSTERPFLVQGCEGDLTTPTNQINCNGGFLALTILSGVPIGTGSGGITGTFDGSNLRLGEPSDDYNNQKSRIALEASGGAPYDFNSATLSVYDPTDGDRKSVFLITGPSVHHTITADGFFVWEPVTFGSWDGTTAYYGQSGNILPGARARSGIVYDLGAQLAAIADATDEADCVTKFNTLLSELRSAGILAT